MFSTITTALSTRIPIEMASPPSDIRLAVIPNRYIGRNAPITVSGRINPAVSALRQLAKNNASTTSTKTMPSASAASTVATARPIKSLRS